MTTQTNIVAVMVDDKLQRAARSAATRRNNKLQRDLPLLADLWATTPEAEAERITRQRIAAQECFARLAAAEVERWGVGMERREIARTVLSAERWQDYDKLFHKIFPYAKPETDGARLADWWWYILKGTPYAFGHCPHRELHYDESWWESHWDFLLGQFVDTVICPTCGMPRP